MTLDVRGSSTVLKAYITVIIKSMNLLILINLYYNLTKKRIILYPPNSPLFIFLLVQMFDTERRNCI